MYAEVFQFYHDFGGFNKKVIIMLKKVFSKNSEVLFKNRVNFIFKFVAKRLNFGLISYGGRNFNGRICVYHRGGGNKRIFRSIDRFRRLNQVGTIMRLFKFPIFSALVGFIIYDNGLSSFIILSSKVREGSRVFSGIFSDVNNKKNYKNVSFSLGSTMLLEKVSLFSQINSIEVAPTKGFVLARAAGTSAFLTSREINDRVWLKLSSGWQILLSKNCLAVLGSVSNPNHIFTRVRKAGIVRLKGFRPIVRGVAKNPCDHPHGGGEGKGSPPRAQVSPWGRLTKGTPTKNRKKDRLYRRLFKEV